MGTTQDATPPQAARFNGLARLLHWAMAAMVLTMLFVGVTMVASYRHYATLVALHRPLGIAILLLACVRLANRLLRGAPPLPATVPPPERVVAVATEYAMYALMFAMPLIGWGMLSAARHPVTLFGPVQLPYILPQSLRLYAALRAAHTVLAYAFFLAILGHVGAILFHTLVVRDGLIRRMLPGRRPPHGADAPGR